MAQSVHYEVFVRQGGRVDWSLIEVRNDRESALEFAQALMTEKRATAGKVVKETYYDDTGDFLSLKIFEDGHNQIQMKTAPAEEEVPHTLPCSKPDDLYSLQARSTIARLISDFLARNRITVTELGHRADLLEKLEATGTLLQHAIQKIAVAQASSLGAPVAQIVKGLNELVERTIHRVYRDARKGLFPTASKGGFGKLAARLAGQGEGAYLLNGALAQYLKDAAKWDDKIARLIALMPEA